ncbi:undecaprenyl/decaprenyl-phosphate alpha-N-acetylglucosaminyl 1-phosphate transferase [Belliella sp. DSM 107340]|uniref:Undecaprenyl/decaprenyl-phosphate alpha-N-acetylglucosaminyl 1-phosphate transferase n=1 Tax=Belliella calami TaxID=2923436 RepID=A0ABS9UNY0_9BACT|nr:MraY family glycosyltransferase [Belliella calami]MCH7398331.1 undecaprenyl/decaprenyl-phosphate alpha-N-acetylglucosaminyl 1-phosphate transferase [Belliella calami]
MVTFLAIFTAFLIGFLITPVLILVLKRLNLIDAPGGRKIHNGFIPSMGGISFVVGAIISVLTWFSMSQLIEIRFLLTAFGLMFLLGLRDDMVDISAWQKIGGQLIAACIVVVFGDIRFSSMYGFLGIYEIPDAVSYGISIFTIIALTNSFNLIDGLDGLAGSVSVVTFLFLGWWFMQAGMIGFSMFAFILVGGVISFLVFNWHPAKIFMGDTGSLSLGFALAVMTILFVDSNGNMNDYEGWKFSAPIASGIALLIIPIYDTCRIFTKRTMKGKSPLAADKSHIHHFMMRMGLRHDQVTITIVLINSFFIGMMFIGSNLNDHVLIPIIAVMAVILGLRLDVITLSRVKKIHRETPPILSLRERKKKASKPNVNKEILEKVNLTQN